MKFYLLKIYTILLMLSFCGCNSKETTINVGAIFPMSGDWGSYGEQMANGIKLWETEHPNSNIKVIYEDGQGNVNASINAFNKLAHTNKIQVCISGVSPVMLGISSLAHKNNIFTINAGATNPDIKNTTKNVFCIIPDASVEAKYISNFLLDTLNKKSCFIYWKNDDSGKGMMQSFAENFQKKGGVIVGDEAIGTPESIKSTLTKVKKMQIRTIFIPTNGEMIAKIIRQAYNMGMKDILWVGYAAAEAPELIDELKNIDNPKFIFSSYSYKSTIASPKTHEFIKKYESLFKKTPQYYSATCYDAITMITNAVENNCKTSEEIKKYIYALDKFEGVSGILAINGNNYVSSGMIFCMFSDNKVTPIDIAKF